MDKGYKGRTGIYEGAGDCDDMVQEMILNRRSAQEITRAARRPVLLTYAYGRCGRQGSVRHYDSGRKTASAIWA
jgi:type II secretory ATPase GspE/PulE/Tfp pilus assembly ATPase PilB-like protein